MLNMESMTRKDPMKGHGLLEVLVSTRPGKDRPLEPVLTPAETEALYRADPFRKCHLCTRPGFIWCPPFTAHSTWTEMPLLTWKDGRKIIPRPLCWGCVNGWGNFGRAIGIAMVGHEYGGPGLTPLLDQGPALLQPLSGKQEERPC